MKFKFKNKKISGMLSVVPENRVRFRDEIEKYSFSAEKCIDLQNIMGFNERRIVAGEECGSDMVMFGINYLIETGKLDTRKIAAIVLITQTPDFFMPPTSCIIHGKLNLASDVLCFDINQGCAGFLYGLLQSFMILDAIPQGQILLLNCDTLSRRANPQDRNIYPLIGDAGTIAIIETDDHENEIDLWLMNDGSRSNNLIIPAGGFRKPSSEQTRQIKEMPNGNKRCEDDFHMNGSGVFTFTQTDVARSINEFFEKSRFSKEEIDYFVFHQPNKFMLQKLAKKINVPLYKLPHEIIGIYGNSSSATIPVTMCHHFADDLLNRSLKMCFSGFGVGLTWGVMSMPVGPLTFCEIIEM